MEYSVEIGVDVGRPVHDGDLADALLSVLEQYEQAGKLAGPVVGAELPSVLVARFNIEAHELMRALEMGQRLVVRALDEMGVENCRWYRLAVEQTEPNDPNPEAVPHPATAPRPERS